MSFVNCHLINQLFQRPERTQSQRENISEYLTASFYLYIQKTKVKFLTLYTDISYSVYTHIT